jgi:putative phosphoesterase
MSATILGVLADTHVPDRTRELHPQLLACFRERQVDAILHAGDISVPRVLAALGEIAPVHAVRGNRDIYYLRHLPDRLKLTFNGISLGMTHGHGNLCNYLVDRLMFYVRGIYIPQFQQRALNAFPDCQVVIFGHIHQPGQQWFGDQLIFNPGSACCPDRPDRGPSVGLLKLGSRGEIQTEWIDLDKDYS